LFVNFVAHELGKANFHAYTGFPFLVSFFWVYLYGALLAKAEQRPRRGWLESILAITALASVVGLRVANHWVVESVASGMFRIEPRDPAATRSFIRLVRDRRRELGRLSVDDSVGALATEALEYEDRFRHTPAPETFLFQFTNTAVEAQVLVDLATARIATCTELAGVHTFACTSSESARRALDSLRGRPLPSGLSLTRFDEGACGVEHTPRGIVFDETCKDRMVATMDPQRWIDPGTYEVVWDLSLENRKTPRDAEVAANTSRVATLEVYVDNALVGKATPDATEERPHLVIPFVVAARQLFTWRLFLHDGAKVTIERAELRVAGGRGVP
jgi:hypothetical protein